jgi:uncharacterized RDD family membrane protein YckC
MSALAGNGRTPEPVELTGNGRTAEPVQLAGNGRTAEPVGPVRIGQRPGATAGYAGAVSRLVAYLLDAFIVSLATSGTAAGLSMVASVAGAGTTAIARAVVSAYVVVVPFLFSLYLGSFWALAGRTPGMAVLGLRVVSARGKPVRWLAAMIRALLVAFFPLGAAWLLVDRRHQALQDKVARTVVVRPIS